MARVSFSGLLNNGRSDLAIVGEGLEPDKEARLGTSLMIVSGRQLKAADESGVLLGSGVARALALNARDRVTAVANTTDGATNTIDLEVVGSLPDLLQGLRRTRDQAQPRDRAGAARQRAASTRWSLRLRHGRHRPWRRRLPTKSAAAGLEVKTWEELNDFYAKTVKLYDTQFGVLRLIVLVLVVLCVANSINMSVFERTAEFGTMRALGNRSADVFRLIVTEACLIGRHWRGLRASLRARLIAWGISAIGIPMPPPPNADIGYMARIPLVGEVVAGALPSAPARRSVAGVVAAAARFSGIAGRCPPAGSLRPYFPAGQTL